MAQTYPDGGNEEEDLNESVEALADAGLLTVRQAQAYYYREIMGLGRYAVADEIWISASTLDDYLRDAKDKLEAAEETMDVVEQLREEHR